MGDDTKTQDENDLRQVMGALLLIGKVKETLIYACSFFAGQINVQSSGYGTHSIPINKIGA